MAEVRWTPQAADDLEAITDFIAADSPQYASLFAIDVLNAVERLQVFPRSGRVVPEVHAPDIREIVLGNYRIVYRIRADFVEILTVWHGSRLLDPSRLT
jgi:addiction module RelE/StbE family toxin